MTDQQPLKILYLSAEAVPFAKTGGLADVAGCAAEGRSAAWDTTSA